MAGDDHPPTVLPRCCRQVLCRAQVGRSASWVPHSRTQVLYGGQSNKDNTAQLSTMPVGKSAAKPSHPNRTGPLTLVGYFHIWQH